VLTVVVRFNDPFLVAVTELQQSGLFDRGPSFIIFAMPHLFPLLTTPNLMLSSFDALTDTSAVFAYASDPEVARFTSWMPHRSLTDSAAWIDRIKRSDSVEPGQRHHCWAIRMCHGDGTAVGAVELIQEPADVARVDFVLARLQWGKGLMTEAVTAVLDWAFHSLAELTLVRSGGLAVNLGSIRVMQKCGLILESRETLEFAKFGGAKFEVLNHRISRDAWLLRHS
jgi:[ribosomal protein S5]-alanine N-acetyltransferase